VYTTPECGVREFNDVLSHNEWRDSARNDPTGTSRRVIISIRRSRYAVHLYKFICVRTARARARVGRTRFRFRDTCVFFAHVAPCRCEVVDYENTDDDRYHAIRPFGFLLLFFLIFFLRVLSSRIRLCAHLSSLNGYRVLLFRIPLL